MIGKPKAPPLGGLMGSKGAELWLLHPILLGLFKYLDRCVLDTPEVVHFEEPNTGGAKFLESPSNIGYIVQQIGTTSEILDSDIISPFSALPKRA